MSGCIGKLFLIILGILFFPVSVPILIFKSDMKLRNKLLTVLLFWVGLAAIVIFPAKSGKPDSPGNTSVADEERLPETAIPETTSTAAETTTSSTTAASATTTKAVTTTSSATETPTEAPTDAPTNEPTESPTKAPTKAPTEPPTKAPTKSPTEPPTKSPTDPPASVQETKHHYVLNNNTMKYHYPNCTSVNQIKDENRQEYEGTSSDLKDMGYSPCGRCTPK